MHFPRYGRHADELCVTELASVVWAVQMSTVEFHPWNSRRADVERPDEWRIDLDPMPRCEFATVRRAARIVHEILGELGMAGWPKTSGGNGLHVYVRIEPRWGFADLRRAAHAFAREVERRAPGEVTTTWWRKDRDPTVVFVDYNQNARDHTIASAYSVRGVPEATVSTPITWDEIDDVDPRQFTIATVPARFARLGHGLRGGIGQTAWVPPWPGSACQRTTAALSPTSPRRDGHSPGGRSSWSGCAGRPSSSAPPAARTFTTGTLPPSRRHRWRASCVPRL